MAQFELKNMDGRSVILITGRFTLQDKDAFSNFVRDKVDLSEGDIYVDAIGMSHIDSSAIADLLRLKMDAVRTRTDKKAAFTLHVAGLSSGIRKIFKTAQLDTAFDLQDD